jgi:uncharacterized protein YndB with AHSA1/START domain
MENNRQVEYVCFRRGHSNTHAAVGPEARIFARNRQVAEELANNNLHCFSGQYLQIVPVSKLKATDIAKDDEIITLKDFRKIVVPELTEIVEGEEND